MNRKLPNIINMKIKLPAVIAFALLILLWQVSCSLGLVPSFLLPSPGLVLRTFIADLPMLLAHARITLTEALLGLSAGIVVAFFLAAFMDFSRLLYQALYPILIISQTIPTVAIAPLLVLWMGFGMAPKITVVALTTFFPIAIGLLDGFGSADADTIRFMHSLGANRLQIFFHIKLPHSAGYFFSGLKVSASYAVVGAVISEWLGGFEGLGVYMTRVRKAYAFDKMFAVIILIIIISLLLMAFVNIIRKLVMPWEKYILHHERINE